MRRPCVRIAPHFNNEILPAIKKEYIDTGKVFTSSASFRSALRTAWRKNWRAACPRPNIFPSWINCSKSQPQWDPEYGVQDVRGGLLQQAKIAGMSEEQFDKCNADTKEESIINQGRRRRSGQIQHHRHAHHCGEWRQCQSRPLFRTSRRCGALLDKALADSRPLPFDFIDWTAGQISAKSIGAFGAEIPVSRKTLFIVLGVVVLIALAGNRLHFYE
jgi:hypothetical protein